MALTPAQKERIEKNRLAALERKRALATADASNNSTAPLSQDSHTSGGSSTNSYKKYRASGRENPYISPSSVAIIRPTSPVLSREEKEARENRRLEEERKARESALLPPLPEGSRKLRDVTANRYVC